jgi:hypothetical protein
MKWQDGSYHTRPYTPSKLPLFLSDPAHHPPPLALLESAGGLGFSEMRLTWFGVVSSGWFTYWSSPIGATHAHSALPLFFQIIYQDSADHERDVFSLPVCSCVLPLIIIFLSHYFIYRLYGIRTHELDVWCWL